MRVLALLALALASALVLPGCTQNDPGTGGESFTPTCPSWIKYPHPAAQTMSRGHTLVFYDTRLDIESWDFRAPSFDKDGNEVRGTALGGDYLKEYDGHPLDFMRMDFSVKGAVNASKTILLVIDAEVHLEFIAEDGGYPTGEVVPSWDTKLGLTSSRDEWVFRSNAQKGYEVFNVTLQLDLADIADDPNPRGVFAHWTWQPNLDEDVETPSILERGYSPELWYRTCSKDGTRV